jgi:hypothetical protein
MASSLAHPASTFTGRAVSGEEIVRLGGIAASRWQRLRALQICGLSSVLSVSQNPQATVDGEF